MKTGMLGHAREDLLHAREVADVRLWARAFEPEDLREVRRALDLLLSQPQVDRRRLGFVGHDYGAMYGSIVSGVERRVKTYVFMTAHPRFSDWSLKYWPVTAKAGEETYRQATKEIDPINYVSHAAPAALFFQFATSDKFIPRDTALGYFAAAGKPKQIRWYDTVHELNIEAARTDRRVWLTRKLGLGAKRGASVYRSGPRKN